MAHVDPLEGRPRYTKVEPSQETISDISPRFRINMNPAAGDHLDSSPSTPLVARRFSNQRRGGPLTSCIVIDPKYI